MTPFRRSLSALTLALFMIGPAVQAQTIDKGAFDLTIRGIRAGVLAFDGVQEGGRYAVAGRLKSAGIVAWVRKVSYEAKAWGSINDARYVPSRYEEKADTGKRQSESVMEYLQGVPQVKVYNPPRPAATGDVDPASQGGTVDPLTALYATLRDVPADQACTLQVQMFDGKRRSQLTLSPAEVKGDTITCAGEYRRLQGFSANEMAEKSRFPFRLTYAPTGTGMVRVTEVWMDSLYGKASLKRR